jgi:hypothetical protein
MGIFLFMERNPWLTIGMTVALVVIVEEIMGSLVYIMLKRRG